MGMLIFLHHGHLRKGFAGTSKGLKYGVEAKAEVPSCFKRYFSLSPAMKTPWRFFWAAEGDCRVEVSVSLLRFFHQSKDSFGSYCSMYVGGVGSWKAVQRLYKESSVLHDDW